MFKTLKKNTDNKSNNRHNSKLGERLDYHIYISYYTDTITDSLGNKLESGHYDIHGTMSDAQRFAIKKMRETYKYELNKGCSKKVFETNAVIHVQAVPKNGEEVRFPYWSPVRSDIVKFLNTPEERCYILFREQMALLSKKFLGKSKK